ncbi:hypothetical protein APY19_02280 [Listeria monocytogenes]|nr:hypothetical protein [Listeria monocytogenes]
MYNQKCNEMSDSYHERLKTEFFCIYSYTIRVILWFSSRKNTHFASLFTIYTLLFPEVTKSTHFPKINIVFYIKSSYFIITNE